MVSLLQTGRFVVVRFIARYNITELKNQYSFSLFHSATHSHLIHKLLAKRLSFIRTLFLTTVN